MRISKEQRQQLERKQTLSFNRLFSAFFDLCVEHFYLLFLLSSLLFLLGSLLYYIIANPLPLKWFLLLARRMSAPPAFVSYASEIFSVPPETFRKTKLRLPLAADDEQKLSTALDKLISRSVILTAGNASEKARSFVLQTYRYPCDLRLQSPLDKLIALTFLSVKLQVFEVPTLLIPCHF